MNTKIFTAPELLKTYGSKSHFEKITNIGIGTVLRKLVRDKKYSLKAVKALSSVGIFGSMVEQLLLKVQNNRNRKLFNSFGSSLDFFRPTCSLKTYKGEHEENRLIDRAISAREIPSPNQLEFFGEGAATYFPASVLQLPLQVSLVPICIIGYGASGILAAAALTLVGFRNVRVFEKSKPMGIWSFPNVYKRSRNNPRDISFLGRKLDKAPGPGEEIHNFLKDLQGKSGIVQEYAIVQKVLPKAFRHQVVLSTGEIFNFPIVINCMGLGKPVPLSDPRRMVTNATNAQAGPRWQQELSREKVSGKRFIFIGLGNSTAEMIDQLYALKDQGVDVDFRIFTHYPKDAVQNPESYVSHEDRTFRVFRDLSKPNLVDFQGDLPASRRNYFRALQEGKIVSGVRRWEVAKDKNQIGAFDEKGSILSDINFDRIFTLTGYKHTRETFHQMGCVTDENHECAKFDFDGEFHSSSSSPSRNAGKGYFGFGSILETPQNPNAIVIPGMIHRIGDLLFGVIMRATEHII